MISRARRRRRMDPRRSLALTTRRDPRTGRLMKRATTARQAATIRRVTGTTTRRRGGFVGAARRLAARARERARTAAAQQRALAERQAAQIAEAERLARESVTPPPTVTDRNGWRRYRPRPPIQPPTIHPGPACQSPRPPARPGGVWQCIRGNWSFQQIATTMPVVTNGAPAPATPPAWWLERPDTTGRATRGELPPPPGLPGGPSMRPPPSGRDTATEIVGAEAPAAGMDMKKILPLVAGAALLMLGR